MEAHKHQTFTYKRRRPQDTPCYQIVQNHLETFLAQRQLENRPLPLHVVTEFNEYLKCGILAHGFIRLKCAADKNGEVVLHPDVDPLFAENEALTLATQSSISGKIAFGPNAGKYVTRIGSGFGYEEETPLIKGKRCASVNGFSLHCNTAVNTHQRDRLEKFISYIARGPLSNERLGIKDGKVLLQLKTPWKNGTTHLELTHQEFIEKLVALTPPPKAHLVRWAGVFAPNSAYRKLITLKPEAKKGFDSGEGKDGKNYTWSKMLARIFKIDVLACDHCGGRLQWICAVHDTDSIKRYLKHIGENYDAPIRAPPRTSGESFDFEHVPDISIEPSIHYD